MGEDLKYCESRFWLSRRKSREVDIGGVKIGSHHPIAIQSMTNTSTFDTEGTVKQSIALVESGCDIVRVTAQNLQAARNLKNIRQELNRLNIKVPLVADIHFLPEVAMEAVEHVEKIRINPGNFADKKKFLIKEYTDQQYQEELDRIYDKVSPLIKRCKELGRALRIGTNHGSLSDRIMNRYGDTPLGMVESALEFIRIAESHGFYNIVLSMKASNPKVMIEAYRLAVAKMAEEGMYYPLHLGVTEAGDGEDARMKSAIGIGSLLMDGLGDTIRVSLTEDPVREIPVAKALADRAHILWNSNSSKHNILNNFINDSINPYEYNRREIENIIIHHSISENEQDKKDYCGKFEVGMDYPPRVLLANPYPLEEVSRIVKMVCGIHATHKECKVEGLILKVSSMNDVFLCNKIEYILAPTVGLFILEILDDIPTQSLIHHYKTGNTRQIGFAINIKVPEELNDILCIIDMTDALLILKIQPEILKDCLKLLKNHPKNRFIITYETINEGNKIINLPTVVGVYRWIAEVMREEKSKIPLWLRFTSDCDITDVNNILLSEFKTGDQLSYICDSGMTLGNLLCDGMGDMVSIEGRLDPERNVLLGYNLLQGTRMRMIKTEFVACPSCGRTLFDLETTTAKVREHTGHLKGVTIAIMGCIVNGPGEMADADFGYVGGAPGKINLYVGKKCVEYNIPEDQAVSKLIELIKIHHKWVDPNTGE